MKKRHIEKMIRRDAFKATPEVLEKIKQHGSFDDMRETPLPFRKKPLLASLVFALSVVSLFIVFAIARNTTEPSTHVVFADETEMFAVATMTATGLFEQYLNLSNDVGVTPPSHESVPLTMSELNRLSQHITLIEPLLQEGVNNGFIVIDSPLAEYEKMVIFTGRDLRLRPVEFTLHMTASLQNDGATHYDGIVIFSNVHYYIEGTVDSQSKWMESVLHIAHETRTDVSVHVEHTLTDSGQSFTYTFRSDDAIISTSALHIASGDSSVVSSITLSKRDIDFTIHKHTVGFTQKLSIEYRGASTGHMTMRVVYDTATKEQQYLFTLYEADRIVVIHTKRNMHIYH